MEGKESMAEDQRNAPPWLISQMRKVGGKDDGVIGFDVLVSLADGGRGWSALNDLVIPVEAQEVISCLFGLGCRCPKGLANPADAGTNLSLVA